MFYEKLNFLKFDFEKLKKDVLKNVFTLGDQVIQGEEFETPQYRGFGGWSLTSRTGDWQDGFEFFQAGENDSLQNSYFPEEGDNFKSLKYLNIAHSMEYKNPTQACVGEIASLIKQIEDFGLTPRRARVTCLKSGCKSLVHSDGPKSEYIARIHIPLFTNSKCVFISNGIDLHMEEGSAYMVWVNDWHQIRNDSDEDRYHIIMDAYDTKHITKHFKYEGDISQLEEYANKFRGDIDNTILTPEDITRFDTVKQQYVTKK
jgi:hypothetical protein